MNVLVICQWEPLANLLDKWLTTHSKHVLLSEDYYPTNPLLQQPEIDIVIIACVGEEIRDYGEERDGSPRQLGRQLVEYCIGLPELAPRVIILRHSEERWRDDGKCCYLNICKPHRCYRCLGMPFSEESLNRDLDALIVRLKST